MILRDNATQLGRKANCSIPVLVPTPKGRKDRRGAIKSACQRLATSARTRAHTLSRLLLAAAQVELAASIAAASIAISPWPVAIGLALDGLKGLKRNSQLWSHGSARWADESDLRREGMIGRDSGLMIGRIQRTSPFGWMHRIAPLFNRAVSSRRACEAYLAFSKEVPVRLSKTPHTVIFGPTGMGKGTSFIMPWLLDVDESAVVLDVKGDIATATAAHRERVFGHQCVFLDPYELVTKNPDSLNPIDFIDGDSPNAIDDCRSLAEQLVVRNLDEKEPHWNDAAEMFIAAALVGVVRHAERGDRSLQTVRDVLTNTDNLPKLIALLGDMGGMFSRIGGSLMYFRDKEFSSALTTVNRQLRFLDTPAISASTEKSTFNPLALRDGKMTVYCILPPEFMRAQSGLIRMWIGTLLRCCVKRGLQQNDKIGNVNFLLDEAVSLGPNMTCVEDAIDKYRGYGVRLQLYYQALAQLKKCFPNGQDQTVLANATQLYFATNSQDAAEAISSRLGDQTIIIDSGGTGSGYSTQMSGGRSPESTTTSSNSNRNWSPHGRRLLKPEEILALDPRIAITFVPGMPPIRTRLERYYERSATSGRMSSTGMLFKSIVTFLMATLLCAIVMFACFAFAKESSNGTVRGNGKIQTGSGGGTGPVGDAGLNGTGISPVQRQRIRSVRTRPVHANAGAHSASAGAASRTATGPGRH